MPGRMKANRNFSYASLERFYAVGTNCVMSSNDAVDLGLPCCNSTFEFQVVHRCVFTVV